MSNRQVLSVQWFPLQSWYGTHFEHDRVVAPPNVRVADHRPNVTGVAVAVVPERGDLLGVGERR